MILSIPCVIISITNQQNIQWNIRPHTGWTDKQAPVYVESIPFDKKPIRSSHRQTPHSTENPSFSLGGENGGICSFHFHYRVCSYRDKHRGLLSNNNGGWCHELRAREERSRLWCCLPRGKTSFFKLERPEVWAHKANRWSLWGAHMSVSQYTLVNTVKQSHRVIGRHQQGPKPGIPRFIITHIQYLPTGRWLAISFIIPPFRNVSCLFLNLPITDPYSKWPGSNNHSPSPTTAKTHYIQINILRCNPWKGKDWDKTIMKYWNVSRPC